LGVALVIGGVFFFPALTIGRWTGEVYIYDTRTQWLMVNSFSSDPLWISLPLDTVLVAFPFLSLFFVLGRRRGSFSPGIFIGSRLVALMGLVSQAWLVWESIAIAIAYSVTYAAGFVLVPLGFLIMMISW